MQTETEVKKKENFFNKKNAKYIVLGAFLVLFALFFGFFVKASSYDKIFPNVSMAGIDLSGLTESEVRSLLLKEYKAPFEEKSFKITLLGDERVFSASDIDGKFDLEQSVSDAYNFGRDRGVFLKTFSYMGALMNETELVPCIKYDKKKLVAIIDDLCEGKETEMVETSYSVEGYVLTLTNGHGGDKVVREKAEKEILEALESLSDKPVSLYLERINPKDKDLNELYEKIIINFR